MSRCRLDLCIQALPEDPLYSLYVNAVEKHNAEMENSETPNSGFDIFVPVGTTVPPNGQAGWIDHRIKAVMVSEEHMTEVPVGYFLFPRSSISKTPLMLANQVGVIDSGYRGNLIGAFRNLSATPYAVSAGTRLLQICHPSLKPFRVQIVESVDMDTERGEGGFGSTGV